MRIISVLLDLNEKMLPMTNYILIAVIGMQNIREENIPIILRRKRKAKHNSKDAKCLPINFNF